MKRLVFCSLLVSLYLILLFEALNVSASTYCVSEKGNCASLNGGCVECWPLMWFVNKAQTIPNDSTINFLPGNLSLNSSKDESHISFEGKMNLTLRGIGGASTVMCSGNETGFSFLSSSNITVQQLNFQNCGATNSSGLYGAVFFSYVRTIQMIRVGIKNSTGFGLYIEESYGNITITDSHLAGNSIINKHNCDEELKQHYATQCDINNETITRPNSTTEWMGYLQNKTVFALSKNCQEGRCKQGGSPLSIHNLSEVCVEGREGRVCGKCKPDYSLSIGPLNCIPTIENCSIWKFFLLLVVFFLSGIFLVCFLAIFNLTVTEGTINGLLFYAN